jgi:hypothetical protein
MRMTASGFGRAGPALAAEDAGEGALGLAGEEAHVGGAQGPVIEFPCGSFVGTWVGFY